MVQEAQCALRQQLVHCQSAEMGMITEGSRNEIALGGGVALQCHCAQESVICKYVYDPWSTCLGHISRLQNVLCRK